jgi:predicted small secreted protein
MVKKIFLALVLISFCVASTGCGETISGIGKDVSRMGKGIKTVFIAEDQE